MPKRKIKLAIPSPNQSGVIRDTLKDLSQGKSVNKWKILKNNGYAHSVQNSPQVVYDSKAVKQALQPFLDGLDDARKRALSHLDDKKLSKSSGRDLAYIIHNITQDHQLLTGGDTERTKTIVIPSELIEKNEINSS